MYGIRLKELRTEKGLSQRQLSVFLECTQSMITRWEKCECEPTESVIRRTAILFDVSSDYLIGLEDETGTKINKNVVNSFNNNSGNINFRQ